jgi:putative ABC transport system ATP-binding protein
MIQFNGVTVRAGGKTLLAGVSFGLAEGEKAVFRGASGSGKSTILLTLVGVHAPEAGEVRYKGATVDPHTVGQVRRDAAYVPQEPVLGAASVRAALRLPYTFKAHADHAPSEGELAELLDVFKLRSEILDQDVASLSGGEKQRLAVARAVLLDKTVFILDEVTSALDPESRGVVTDVLLDSPRTVVSVSHDPEWIARCSRVFAVEEGRVQEVDG